MDNNFQSTHVIDPNVSTKTDESVISKLMCIYIHTYTQKRRKEKRSDRKNIVIYDLDQYESLEELARRERTNVSSIINNLYEDFLKKVESPQKAIDTFAHEKVTPSIDASPVVWRAFLKSLDKTEYKEFDKKLQTVLSLHDRRCNELR